MPLRACDQAGVDDGEGLAEEFRANRSRLDQLIDREACGVRKLDWAGGGGGSPVSRPN